MTDPKAEAKAYLEKYRVLPLFEVSKGPYMTL